MGLKIDRKQDKRVVHACTHMLADIPNGVTVCSSELVAGGIFAGRDGIRRQRRCRALPRSKDRKAYRRRYRHYKSLQGGERTSFQSRRFYHVEGRRKGLQDTSINTSETLYDTINVGTTLGEAATAGAALYLPPLKARTLQARSSTCLKP